MNFVQNFPFFTIILSLSGGVICSVLNRKNARNYCLFALTLILLLSAATLGHVISTGESYVYLMGHFTAPWGNEIRIGILECMMTVLFTLVMILSLAGSMDQTFNDTEESKTNIYFSMIMLLMSSLLALVYTNDLFTGYVFVEINTISACALVMVNYRSGKALVATLRYLIMSLLGSGLFLLGICTLYSITGHLLMENIAISVKELVTTGQYLFPLAVVVGLFSMGLALKSGLFPFHTWARDAYGKSTIGSSAILSGLVQKGYIFLLIKLFYRVLGMDVVFEAHATDVLFAFGICAMIYCSYKATKERYVKHMLAMSSVAQVGYIFVGIGLGTTAGIAAACLQIIAHTITKPMLFIAAGSFMKISGGKKDFKDMRGAGLIDKLGGFAFLVGSLSMIGIPFFAGFVAKVFLSTAALEVSTIKIVVTLAALAISTLLNACYYIPALYTLLNKPLTRPLEKPELKYSFGYVFSMVVFVGLNFFVGIFSSELFTLISQGISMFG